MPITLKCSCGEIMSVSEEHAGKVGKCPHCSKPNRIPTLEEIARFKKESARQKKQTKEEEQVKAPTAKSGKKITSRIEKTKFGAKAKSATGKIERGKTAIKGKPLTEKRAKTAALAGKKGRPNPRDDVAPPKKDKLVPIIVIAAVVLIGGIAAMIIFSEPDIHGALQTYERFREASNPLVNSLSTYSRQLREAGVGEFPEQDYRGYKTNIDHEWRTFQRRIENIGGVERSTIYKRIEHAKNVFVREIEEEANKLQRSSVVRDPEQKSYVIREIRNLLWDVQELARLIREIIEERENQIKNGINIS